MAQEFPQGVVPPERSLAWGSGGEGCLFWKGWGVVVVFFFSKKWSLKFLFEGWGVGGCFQEFVLMKQFLLIARSYIYIYMSCWDLRGSFS